MGPCELPRQAKRARYTDASPISSPAAGGTLDSPGNGDATLFCSSQTTISQRCSSSTCTQPGPSTDVASPPDWQPQLQQKQQKQQQQKQKQQGKAQGAAAGHAQAIAAGRPQATSHLAQGRILVPLALAHQHFAGFQLPTTLPATIYMNGQVLKHDCHVRLCRAQRSDRGYSQVRYFITGCQRHVPRELQDVRLDHLHVQQQELCNAGLANRQPEQQRAKGSETGRAPAAAATCTIRLHIRLTSNGGTWGVPQRPALSSSPLATSGTAGKRRGRQRGQPSVVQQVPETELLMQDQLAMQKTGALPAAPWPELHLLPGHSSSLLSELLCSDGSSGSSTLVDWARSSSSSLRNALADDDCCTTGDQEALEQAALVAAAAVVQAAAESQVHVQGGGLKGTKPPALSLSWSQLDGQWLEELIVTPHEATVQDALGLPNKSTAASADGPIASASYAGELGSNSVGLTGSSGSPSAGGAAARHTGAEGACSALVGALQQDTNCSGSLGPLSMQQVTANATAPGPAAATSLTGQLVEQPAVLEGGAAAEAERHEGDLLGTLLLDAPTWAMDAAVSEIAAWLEKEAPVELQAAELPGTPFVTPLPQPGEQQQHVAPGAGNLARVYNDRIHVPAHLVRQYFAAADSFPVPVQALLEVNGALANRGQPVTARVVRHQKRPGVFNYSVTGTRVHLTQWVDVRQAGVEVEVVRPLLLRLKLYGVKHET